MRSFKARPKSVLFLSFGIAIALASEARAQKLSEVVAHHAGVVDDHEYVEIFGNPSTDYSALRIVVVDGAASGNPGRIASVFTPGTTNGAGFWTTGFMTTTLESSTLTFLLVSGLTGVVGNDLDTNDDGALDAAPWSAIIDSVALSDAAAGSRAYSPALLGPDFDGLGVAPGGASRFPYYRDTDTTSDWKRNTFDGDGLPGFTGTLAPGEAVNTPGWPTRVHLADYYGAVDSSSSATLRATLHDAIKGHVWFPYTSSTTDTWNILNDADEDPVDTSKVWDIYRNESYTKIPGGTGPYNREHSWPNSLGFPVDTMVPYTDCHHLFVSEVTWNANRGNKPYGYCPSGCTANATVANHGFGGVGGAYPSDSNWYSGSVWETWNHRRGDVARAQLYLDVRYEGGTHAATGAFEPDLILTDNAGLIVGKTTTPASPQAYMGLLTAILAWHGQDPPDAREVWRNDVVSSYQGNRNPFVDHPEWAACIFQSIGCAPRLADAATIDTSVGATSALRHLSTSPQVATSWTWEVLARPAGSTAPLSSTAIRNPTFTPDQPGSYTFRLTASNGTATSITTVSLTTTGSAVVSPTFLYTLTPCRILDTRDPDGPLGGPSLASGSDRLFTMTGVCGVPATARALSVNVTVVVPAAAGHLNLHAGDEAASIPTALSFAPGRTRANNALLKLAADGSAGILNESAGATHVIVDVNGYFQ